MLSDKEKKEILADALSDKRRQEFLEGELSKPKVSSSLDNYINFLMDVQKIKPFEHKPVITPTDKNIL
jgi:hypothetical protein